MQRPTRNQKTRPTGDSVTTNDPSSQPLTRAGRSVAGSLRHSSILVVIGAVLFAAIYPLSARYEPQIGPKMLLLAVAVCVGVGIKMIVIEHTFFGFHSGLLTMAMGMVFRMGIPLMVCGIVTIQFGKEMGQSLARYLLVVYPITLLLETLLTVFHFNAEDDIGGGGQVTEPAPPTDNQSGDIANFAAVNFE